MQGLLSGGKADTTVKGLYFRFWHKADISCTAMSAYEGKADMEMTLRKCPLMTQSRYSLRPHLSAHIDVGLAARGQTFQQIVEQLQDIAAVVVGAARIAHRKGIVEHRLHETRRVGQVLVGRAHLLGIDAAVAVRVGIPVRICHLGEADGRAADRLGVGLDRGIELVSRLAISRASPSSLPLPSKSPRVAMRIFARSASALTPSWQPPQRSILTSPPCGWWQPVQVLTFGMWAKRPT